MILVDFWVRIESKTKGIFHKCLICINSLKIRDIGANYISYEYVYSLDIIWCGVFILLSLVGDDMWQ